MDWVDLEDEAEKGLYTSRYISLSHCPVCCLFSHPHTYTYTADKERDQLWFEEEREERRRPPKKRTRPVVRDRPTAHIRATIDLLLTRAGEADLLLNVRAVLGMMIITRATL